MSTEILGGYSPAEKSAYITAIASIATADTVASDTELAYLHDLADHVGLSEDEKGQVTAAAKDTSGASMRGALDILKSSNLKYSLVADLIAFAESDNTLAEQEKEHISSIAQYLGVNADQLKALKEYVYASATQPAVAMATGGEAGPEAAGIVGNLGGITDKLKSSGIDLGSLTKGLISFVGPMILGNMMSKGIHRGAVAQHDGGLGSVIGSLGSNQGSGGLGSVIGSLAGGNQQQAGGGLGSLISSLSGGKGFSGIGGFLSKILK